MPILESRVWRPTATKVPEGCKPDDLVFHVQATNEIFKDYEEYLARIRLLTSKIWTSTSGKTGLTYQQAYREDQRAQQLLERFPKELEEPMLRTVHHSLLPLEELVDAIHSAHCSPSNSGKENLSGVKQNTVPEPLNAAKDPALALPREVICCWLLSAAEKEEHGSRGLWVAKPDLQQRYDLPGGVPEEVAVILAKAEKDAQANAKKPKSPSKVKAGGEVGIGSQPGSPANPKAKEAADANGNALKPKARAKKPKDAGDAASSPGAKRKAGGAAGTPAKDKAKTPAKSKKKECEPTMGSGQPKSSLKKGKKAGDGGVSGGIGVGKSPVKCWMPAKRKAEGAAGEDVSAEGILDNEPVRTIEEEEARIKPGTHKAAAFQVLKEAGAEGLSVPQIVESAKAKGIKDYNESHRKYMLLTVTSDPAFVRVKKGIYALHALMGDLPFEIRGKTPKSKPRAEKLSKMEPGTEGAPKGALAKAAKPNAGASPGTAAKVAKPKVAASLAVAAEDEEEVESMTKAELTAHQVKKALQLHQQSLAKAQAAEQRARARLENAAKEPRTPSKKVHEDALGPMPTFELSEEQKAFQGDPNDVKDTAKHRNRMKALSAKLKAAKETWLQRLADARERDAKASGFKEVANAQRALKSAQKRVSTAKAEVATAADALKEASRAAHKEQAKKAAEERKAEEKRVREEARQAEKERKRQEALEAKRYPMDDQALLLELRAKAQAAGEPLPSDDVPLPTEQLSQEDSEATASLLYIADLVLQFSKTLGVKCPGYQDLSTLLGPSNEKIGSGNEEQMEALWELYHGLLTALLKASEDDSDDEAEGDLLDMLGPGTWGEVLRRYVHSSWEDSNGLVSEAVKSAADVLRVSSAEDLTGTQHRKLLVFLCDEVLDSENMRSALQSRLDASDDVKREMREAVAEVKGSLKELLDAEKEERRKKREEEAARKAKAEMLKKAEVETAAASKAGTPDVPDAAELPNGAIATEDTRKEGASRDGSLAQEDEPEDVEPVWELPPHLLEYQGDFTDRKAMLTFRQLQQSARQKLEKDKERWHVAARQRAKEREARERVRAEAERAKARKKAEAEEEVVRQQEAYERELEKFNIRRAPLGQDRHIRRYWWGAAGQRGALFVEDEQGRWTVLRSRADLDALIAALDKRGLRELALHSALDKAYNSIIQGMKRAVPAAAEAKAASKAAERPAKRERTQVALYNPAAEEARHRNAKASMAVVQGLRSKSIEAAVDALAELQQAMVSWGLHEPQEGWKAWMAGVKDAAKDALAADGEGEAELQSRLKERLLDAEEMLQQTPGIAPESESSEDDTEGGARSKNARLWQSKSDQTSWKEFLMQDISLAGLAYSAAQLESRGSALLNALEPVRQPKGKKLKALPAAEAPSEPKSKTRKVAPQEPVVMRTTRSRK